MSSLLKNFLPDLNPGAEIDIPPEILQDYASAKKAFARLLGEVRGIELIRKTYEIMDDLEEQGIKNNPIICHSRCAACCLQMVVCTKLEMDLIVEFLRGSRSRDRRLVKKRATEKATKYRELIEGAGILNHIWNDARIKDKLYNLLRLKPCPFLAGGQSGVCGIYPVRPIVCRFTRTADERCGTIVSGLVKPKIQAVKFFFDQIAAEIVAEETEKIYGVLELPPLAIWIEKEDYGNFFKK